MKKKGGELEAITIDRPGPTSLISTTTNTHTHPENETRLLVVEVDSSADQTGAVLRAQAQAAAGLIEAAWPPGGPETDEWKELQRWLQSQSYEVIVPFAPEVVSLIDPSAVRLRRDFPKPLSLIQALAMLHRQSRETTESGAVVAILDDYRVVFELTSHLFAEGAEVRIPPRVREVARAVTTLAQPFRTGPVRNQDVAEYLGLDKAAVSRSVTDAIAAGYLGNDETRPGRPNQLTVGVPPPRDKSLLPTPDELAEACS